MDWPCKTPPQDPVLVQPTDQVEVGLERLQSDMSSNC